MWMESKQELFYSIDCVYVDTAEVLDGWLNVDNFVQSVDYQKKNKRQATPDHL